MGLYLLFKQNTHSQVLKKIFLLKFIAFLRKKSWARVLSNDGLIHEQGHFNISEISARKLMVAFKNYKFNSATVVQDLKKSLLK